MTGTPVVGSVVTVMAGAATDGVRCSRVASLLSTSLDMAARSVVGLMRLVPSWSRR